MKRASMTQLTTSELTISCVRTVNGLCLPSSLPSISLCGETFNEEPVQNRPTCLKCLRLFLEAPDLDAEGLLNLFKLERLAAADITKIIDHEKTRDIWLLFLGLKERYLQIEDSRNRMKATLEELSTIDDDDDDGFVIERTPLPSHKELYTSLLTRVRALAANALTLDDQQTNLLGSPYLSDNTQKHLWDPMTQHADRAIQRWHREQQNTQAKHHERSAKDSIDAVTQQLFENAERVTVKLKDPNNPEFVHTTASIPKLIIDAGIPIDTNDGSLLIPKPLWDSLYPSFPTDKDFCQTCNNTKQVFSVCPQCLGVRAHLPDDSVRHMCDCTDNPWTNDETLPCPDCSTHSIK